MYNILDKQGNVVGTRKTYKSAVKRKDALDNQYGAYVHKIVEVKAV